MFERFTQDARDVVEQAQHEAGALGHDHIGTEHLLLGVAGRSDDVAGRVMGSLGLTPETLRTAVVDVSGFGPLNADALATLGIDLDEVRRRAEEAFGPGALERGRNPRGRGRRPFTPEAKKALELSLREALVLGDKHIGAEHVLLGLLRENGVSAVLVRGGTPPETLRSALLAELSR
jgi:ATP-dependent Clp protease ATP-binding subunit ClpA